MDLRRTLAAAMLVLVSIASPAAPVTLTFHGAVSGYQFIDLGAAGLPVGASVDMSLTFNETFSDGTYDFSDPLGPASGTLSVGGLNFALTGANPYSYTVDASGLTSVTLMFTGAGPVLADGDFYGLFVRFATDLTLASDPLLGYGFTTVYPDCCTVTNYGYAVLTPDHYSITPGGTVPEPASLALALAGLLAAGGSIRWRRRAVSPA